MLFTITYSASEYEGIQRAHEVACFIEEHGEIAGDLLEENYCGC